MQTWILSKEFFVSAEMLDTKRLGAQIYEGIHILASLLSINDKLVNPKRDVSNHPASKLWKGYEKQLLYYIYAHMQRWNLLYSHRMGSINFKNYNIISDYFDSSMSINFNEIKKDVDWITDELIETHKSVLYAKKPEFYANVFGNITEGLPMRYNWRKGV